MNKIYDVVIIGSGPAGLSAAIYASRAKLEAVVVEKQPMSGGQIVNTYEVDNYPGMPGISGYDLATAMRDHAKKLGVSFIQDEVRSIEDNDVKNIQLSEKQLQSKAVVIATGAGHRLLGAEGEEALTGRGVSYCATCDGAFFKDKVVAVVGGGDVAAEDAYYLSRICRKVYLIHRRNELRAAKVLQEKLQEQDNVEIVWNNVVEKIIGEQKVEKVLINNVKVNVRTELEVDGVFVAVGIVPNSGAFAKLASTDERGYFIAKEDCRTSTKGIYAAGDVRTKDLRQVVTAVSDGANAITSIQSDLLLT